MYGLIQYGRKSPPGNTATNYLLKLTRALFKSRVCGLDFDCRKGPLLLLLRLRCRPLVHNLQFLHYLIRMPPPEKRKMDDVTPSIDDVLAAATNPFSMEGKLLLLLANVPNNFPMLLLLLLVEECLCNCLRVRLHLREHLRHFIRLS